MEILAVSVLLGSFFLLLLLGVPVAYSIAVSTLLTMFVSVMPLPAMTTMAQRVATGIDSFALLAIPFFIVAGELMNRGGIAERLIAMARSLVGRLPGGLAYVNIVAAMLFGAVAGSAVAATSAIGSIMTPRMEKEGYDRGYSAAVNVTSSTTGLIIPPSNILIIYSLASGGVSVATLFIAGYIPGIFVGLMLMVAAAITSVRRGYSSGESTSIREVVVSTLRAVPSLVMLLVVIGGIVVGVFTATEAAAVAVLYALILGVLYREIKPADIYGILLRSARTTAVVMFLIGTSIAMSWVLAFEDIPQNLSASLLALSDNPIVILLIINLVLLVVGTFMDMTPAVLIFTPIFLPIVMEMGVDPVHFGIVMVLNLCVGLCTPPVGTILFVGSGVAEVPITRIVRPLIPFVIAMLVALMVITYVPALSMWLPSVMGL